jgi:hypothetical protein
MKAVCCTRPIGSAIVLLARIFNAGGRPIRPSDVAEIEFSVHEHDPRWLKASAIDREQPATLIAAREVISPALVRDGLWAVDDVGYNFRHDIALGVHISAPESNGHVQVRYVFTQIDKTRSTVRFDLKCV